MQKDKEELEMEAQDMIEEMGFCPKCHNHKPCGCPKWEDTQDITNGGYLSGKPHLREDQNDQNG